MKDLRAHFFLLSWKFFCPAASSPLEFLDRPDSKLYSRNPQWYEKDGFLRLPVLELDHSKSITPNIYNCAAKAKRVHEEDAPDYFCPANIEPEMSKKLQHLAWRAHLLLGALDVSRMDIRLDEHLVVNFSGKIAIMN